MANTPPENPGVSPNGRRDSDPSRNVLDLVDAAIQRQDDLRLAESRRAACELDALKDMAALRATHERELRTAEADRINAIRAVDVGAAAILAVQVAESAETLRKQVADTAVASAVSLSSALDPIQKDIADLRRAQYESVGQKTQVVETQAKGGSLGMWIGVGLGAIGLLNAVTFGAVGLLLALR